MRPIARAFVILALCLSLGGHWAALQSIAWTEMIITYSQRAPLGVAVAQTFDGKHPCDFCKHIKSAQHSQKKTDFQPLVTKPDLICPTSAVAYSPPHAPYRFISLQVGRFTRADSPPVPPPRPFVA